MLETKLFSVFFVVGFMTKHYFFTQTLIRVLSFSLRGFKSAAAEEAALKQVIMLPSSGDIKLAKNKIETCAY